MLASIKNININPAEIENKIPALRKLWSYLNKRKCFLAINHLDPKDSLILINKESINHGYLPLGLEIQFSLDIGCNANCIMCDKRMREGISGRSYVNISRILRFIDRPTVSKVSLIGGEPLLDKKGLLFFVKNSRRKGFGVGITTNGYLLTRDYFDLLFRNGLSEITVSLDSCRRQEHDKIRGIDGLFDRVISILRYIKSEYPDFIIGVNYVIMKNNLASVSGMIRLANTLRLQALNFIYISDFGKNFHNLKLSRRDLKSIAKIRASNEALNSRIIIKWDICSSGRGAGCMYRYYKFNVHENGDFLFCGKFPFKKPYKLNKPLRTVLKEREIWSFLSRDESHCRGN